MLISHFSKAKSNTRFSCCTTVTPVSRYRGQRFISEIRTESTLPTFYVTHSETCNLLLPCHAFRDMYPVLPCLGIRDIYHRPFFNPILLHRVRDWDTKWKYSKSGTATALRVFKVSRSIKLFSNTLY